MNKIEWDHPQNPYDSFMVQASAGSGKTYQLSKRFLHLVASGAHPSQILTITFTVKAANEMRSRIINEASKLMVERAEQEAFDAQMRQFHSMNKLSLTEDSYKVKPVLTAREVAKSSKSAAPSWVSGMATHMGLVPKRASLPPNGATKGAWSITLAK